VELLIPETYDKPTVFQVVREYLGALSLDTASVDSDRPWGGFFVIDESQTARFIAQFFPELPQKDIEKGGKLSPKILVVEPNKRLSWQYHHRREEIWKIIAGPVGVITSETDEQGPVQEVAAGQTVQFGTLTRHRLIGLNGWGVVAEIWQHTDDSNPSEESDIIRVSDDFGR
jgi:mannose-6-phosphate isomerase